MASATEEAALKTSELPLPTPKTFSFPYAAPYEIQTRLMRVRHAFETRAMQP